MSKIAITEQLVGRLLSWPLPADLRLTVASHSPARYTLA